MRRARERGTNLQEIEEVIRTGSSIGAKYGRMARAKVFEFHEERNGVYYEQKRVEVYYVMEGETAIAVTAYVFYGRWEA
jgi:hypothetical protein